MVFYSSIKRKELLISPQHEGISNAAYSLQEARLRKLHTVESNYDILGKGKGRKRKIDKKVTL